MRSYVAAQTKADTVPSTADQRARFEQLVFNFERQALALALMMLRDRSVAEEIVQEAFWRAWATPRTPSEEVEFRRWLYRVITNLARDHLRRQARFARLRFWRDAPEEPSDAIDRWVEDQDLARTLRRLSVREQLALHLFYYEDRPMEEVDRHLGTRPGTARKLVSRAVQKLRTKLAVDVAEEPAR